MAQQTAVEWLALRYHQRQGYLSQDDIAQAKAMEKEQIINAWIATDNKLQRLAAEQYYNETYGQKL